MTSQTITSTTSLARRAAIGLMALGLLLSGCAAGSAEKAPSPAATATPADPKEIAADIAATFPTEAEWLENYETGRLCTAEVAGPTNCEYTMDAHGTMSNGFALRDDATGQTAEAVIMQISQHDSEEAAQTQLEEAKARDILFTGDFDIPVNDETNSAGFRGAGALADFEREGWIGYRLSQVAEPTRRDGTASDVATATNSIVMTNGPLTLVLRVYYASTEPGVADAEVTGWLDRVFGPE